MHNKKSILAQFFKFRRKMPEIIYAQPNNIANLPTYLEYPQKYKPVKIEIIDRIVTPTDLFFPIIPPYLSLNVLIVALSNS